MGNLHLGQVGGISSGREHQDSRTGEKCVGKQHKNWGYWWRVEDTGEGWVLEQCIPKTQ